MSRSVSFIGKSTSIDLLGDAQKWRSDVTTPTSHAFLSKFDLPSPLFQLHPRLNLGLERVVMSSLVV